MNQPSNSQINRYRFNLIKYYLEPGKLQARRLHKIQPIELTRVDTRGKVLVRLPSGVEIYMSQEDLLSQPEVFAQTLIDDFWKLFELALTQLENPAVVMVLRTLYEQCYKKMLHYSNSPRTTQRKLAIKSWAITNATMVRRISDLKYFDRSQDIQFQQWLKLLSGSEKIRYRRIKDEGYSSGAISSEINKLYPALNSIVMHNRGDLVLADGSSNNNPEAIVIISNSLSGYVHGNTANVADMTNDLLLRKHIYRSRTILCNVAFQFMSIVNSKWIARDPFSLNMQVTYFRRATPHILRRLNRY